MLLVTELVFIHRKFFGFYLFGHCLLLVCSVVISMTYYWHSLLIMHFWVQHFTRNHRFVISMEPSIISFYVLTRIQHFRCCRSHVCFHLTVYDHNSNRSEYSCLSHYTFRVVMVIFNLLNLLGCNSMHLLIKLKMRPVNLVLYFSFPNKKVFSNNLLNLLWTSVNIPYASCSYY